MPGLRAAREHRAGREHLDEVGAVAKDLPHGRAHLVDARSSRRTADRAARTSSTSTASPVTSPAPPGRGHVRARAHHARPREPPRLDASRSATSTNARNVPMSRTVVNPASIVRTRVAHPDDRLLGARAHHELTRTPDRCRRRPTRCECMSIRPGSSVWPGEVDAARVGRGVGGGHHVGDAVALDDHGLPGRAPPRARCRSSRSGREDDAFAHGGGGYRSAEPDGPPTGVAEGRMRAPTFVPAPSGSRRADTRNMVGTAFDARCIAPGPPRLAAALVVLATVAVLVPAAVAAAPPELTEFPLAEGVSPFGIAPGSDGAMWFTERATDSIGRIDAGWHARTRGSRSRLAPTRPRSRPGLDDAVWFTEQGTNRIGRIAPDGTLVGVPGADRRRRGSPASRPGPTGRCGSPSAAPTGSAGWPPTAPSSEFPLPSSLPRSAGHHDRARRRAVVHRAARQPHRSHHDRPAT